MTSKQKIATGFVVAGVLLGAGAGYAEVSNGQHFNDGPAVLRDPSALVCFSHLVKRSYGGFANFESAAFLVLQSDGTLQCIDWPSTHEFKQARWSGPVPDGVVASAHTHPLSSPFPSPDDVSAAQRIGMPIFVLTPNMINVVHADGHVEMLVYKTWTVRAAR